MPLTGGLPQRLSRSGQRLWQVATHWSAYSAYLDALTRELGAVHLPALGEVRLEEAYVPVRLRRWPDAPREAGFGPPAGGPVVGPTLSLGEALEADAHVLLVGPAGTGKSALLRWHAIQSARAASRAGPRVLFGDGQASTLPLYVPLAETPAGTTLESRVADIMSGHGFDAAATFLEAHLAAGRAVLLFDDLDTLAPDARRAAAERIGNLVARYPNNRVVVATRDVADRAWLPEFTVLEVTGVDPARVETLANRWGYGQLASTSGLLQAVERSPLVRSLVARPGWLAAGLAATSAVEGPIRAYDVVHGFVRHLAADEEEDALWQRVALELHEHETTIGRAELVPTERRGSGLLQWLSEDEFRFVHPAVQAYFAAAALRDPTRLAARAEETWWAPVIMLAAGGMADARPIIEALLADGQTALAALALAEARPADEDLRSRVEVELLDGLGRGGRESDTAAAIGLAGLLGGESVGHTGLVAPALAALSSGPTEVRKTAAAALGRLGDPSAIAPLLSALGDPDAAVRAAASDALASFGGRTVQPLVRQLSVPNDDVRQAAMRALGQQGDRAVDALIPLLDSSSAALRSEAAAALAQIGPPAVPALTRVLQEGPPEGARSEGQVKGAADALERIGRPAAKALVPLYGEAGPATRRRIVGTLQAMGEEAVGTLGRIVARTDDPYSSSAAALLGELPAAAEHASEALVGALGDERFEVRWEARRSLRRLGEAVGDVLVETLDHPDPRVRWEAAQILLDLPDPPTEPLSGALVDILDAGDVEARRRAVRALATLSGAQVRGALERATADPDPLVRRSAASALGALGDPAALETLIGRWQEEDDEETLIALLESMTEIEPEAAVPTLLDALAHEDEAVCRQATALLGDIGEPVVVPLVTALNRRPAELDLDSALRVLERAGQTTRAGGRSPANLARVYHRMLVESLDLDELVYLATTIEWWPPAYELHRTFATLREFLEYTSLGGIGSAESALEWVDEIDEWLRPAAQRGLRQLRLISQAVQYFNRGATRRSKEKGLLAAADRLNTLRNMIGELGEPHTRAFIAVTDHWNGLINDAIRKLQGRADLDLDLRTEQVRIRDVETAAVLVFELINNGEGLASNVQLTLQADADDVALDSAPTHYLPPLGQGDRISAEFTVRRSGAGLVPITIEVQYDDPQTEGESRRFVREVRFVVEEAEYREIDTSPYIAGPPVKSPEMFYGRQSTFTWIQENLSGTYQDNVLVLYGERRTGKTSMLYQLQYHLPETYALVLIDLQSIAYALGSTSDVLYAMARKAVQGLRREDFDLERPTRDEFADHPIEQFELLGERIGQQALADGRRAVIMADEFDLLIEAVDKGDVSAFVFDCIRGLMQHQDGLSFIFAGANQLSAMLRNPQSILFNTALRRKVSFLDEEHAKRLIREPVSDVLWYDDLALEKILRVTAGHPYFIQYICHEIVNLARRDTKNFVALRDVDRALQTTVQETTGIIRHSYMSLERDQQVLLAALARITDDGRPFVSLEDLAETLRQDGVVPSKRDLYETLRQLVERDFIVERGGESAGRQYGFAMDLVRVWLEQNDEYTRLLEELRA